jgi:hypothetical protein
MPPEKSEDLDLSQVNFILNGQQQPPQKCDNLFTTSFSGNLGAI